MLSNHIGIHARRFTSAQPRLAQITRAPDVYLAAFAVASSPHQCPARARASLPTYKYHALGDYSRTIKWMGTTDSY